MTAKRVTNMPSLDCVLFVESLFGSIWVVMLPHLHWSTPQDCIDHMRSAHAVSVTVKASNLARWFPPWTVSRDRWCAAMSSTVSGVATDALLFSRTGVPLVHRYHVFSRAGTHIAFRGTYMARLRTFIYTADAERWELSNWNRARSFASQLSPDDPIVGCHCNPAGPSLHGSSCRTLSPGPASKSVSTPAPESVAPLGVSSCRSGRRATSSLIDLALPRFAAWDYQPEVLQSVWVTTRDNLASPTSLSSPSLCLNLDTLSSDASVAGTGDVPSVEGVDIDPIVISDQELSVISVHSDDPDLDAFDAQVQRSSSH